MKKNKMGFTLIETLIVSAFVAGTLTYLFIQLNNVKTSYDMTFRYDAVPQLYNAQNVAQYLQNVTYNDLKNSLEASEFGYIDITDGTAISNGSNIYYKDLIRKIDAKTVLFVNEDTSDLVSKLDNITTFNEELKHYIKKIDSNQFEGVYRLIIEYNNNTFASIMIGENLSFEENPIIEEYKDTILNGADPVIKGSLVPVVIENDGTVKKADLYSNWYSYENQKWANAVILKDETVTYEDNVVIPEENIESYFVWIPRYRYKIFNEGNYTAHTSSNASSAGVQEIEIEFESKDVTPSTGSTKDSWLTHPAFTTFNVNGMWVGKFETSYDGATSVTSAQVNSNDSSKVIVKPNVYSWRNVTIYNIFTALYNYKRELDSHMIKNTEWGAVAYLSHSKYGINKEVNINNNSSYLTGYSSTSTASQTDYPGTYGTATSVTLPYNTETGYKASTTGNITGVYDMSGGSYEYVAGYMSGIVGESGFTTSNITSYGNKYFDVYNAASTTTSYNKRILGDATGEMGPFNYYRDGNGTLRYHNSWYADYSYFIESPYSWFGRGGHYEQGVLAGQFYFSRYTGAANKGYTSRLVLSFN